MRLKKHKLFKKKVMNFVKYVQGNLKNWSENINFIKKQETKQAQ